MDLKKRVLPPTLTTSCPSKQPYTVENVMSTYEDGEICLVCYFWQTERLCIRCVISTDDLEEMKCKALEKCHVNLVSAVDNELKKRDMLNGEMKYACCYYYYYDDCLEKCHDCNVRLQNAGWRGIHGGDDAYCQYFDDDDISSNDDDDYSQSSDNDDPVAKCNMLNDEGRNAAWNWAKRVHEMIVRIIAVFRQ